MRKDASVSSRELASRENQNQRVKMRIFMFCLLDKCAMTSYFSSVITSQMSTVTCMAFALHVRGEP